MKRVFDIAMALIAIMVLGLPMAVIAILVKLSSRGPVLYWSDRVGRDNAVFRMPKFRTMRVNTPVVATHLLPNPDTYLAPIGRFLRKSSMDELPQLFCILAGHMSVVGPRPALYNQTDLIALRTRANIHTLVPGLTGWAQINGRDELPIPVKVQYDEYYLKHRSLAMDMLIIFRTFTKVLRREGVSH